MNLSLSFISGVIAFLVIGCGGGGGTTVVKPDVNDTNETNQTIIEWELSKEVVPTFSLSTEGKVVDFSTIVYAKHPRLYFRDTDVAYLQAKTTTPYWTFNFKETVTSRLDGKTIAEGIALLKTYEKGDAEYAKMMAFLAFMERDAYYVNLTKAWAMELAKPERVLEDIEGDILLRRRIERLSEIYDWFHDDLTEAEKSTIRASLVRHIERLNSFEYMKTEINYIQKHSRWGHGVIAQALLAMYGDFDASFTKEYADRLLSSTREHLRKYAEAESYIAADGGWHLGWGYAYFNANYTFNYFIWSTATSETMLDDWMGEMTYWYLYALRADDTLPQMGDAAKVNMGYGALSALYQSKFKKDGFAKWYMDEVMKTKAVNQNLFMQFILQDDSVQATAPTSANLPLSRYFKGVGTVIARDTWDRKDATLFIFKSSPFYNAGHHHRDENAFTIDYKTSLALDSGFYDMSDSNHYKNYYVRTIAHNAITVFNPAQVMRYYTDYNGADNATQKIISNDGGQIYKDPDSIVKADIAEGGKNRLDGITAYHQGETYTYAQGDATKAYDPITVTLAKRDVMYITDSGYTHPVVVVLDKVEATDPSFKKRYLLHMESETKPSMDDGTKTMVVVSSKGNGARAKLTNRTLFPTDADIALVGGGDAQFPLYADVLDDTNTTPIDNQSVRDIRDDNDTRTGNYRLEVSPPLGNAYDVMLNVLFVDDENATDVNPLDVQLIGDATMSGAIGVQFPSRVIVFSKEKTLLATPMQYSIKTAGTFPHTVVTGYAKGDKVEVLVNDKKMLDAIVGDGGCVDFSVNASSSDVIRVAKSLL